MGNIVAAGLGLLLAAATAVGVTSAVNDSASSRIVPAPHAVVYGSR